MKRLVVALLTVIFAAGIFAAVALATDGEPGGGHDPVTVCHKPGTPAQKQLTFDNDALGQEQVNGHLGHGDKLGPCTEEPPEGCPEGTVETEDGDCVPIPVDVCSNIADIQTTVPEGYFAIGKLCFRLPPPPPTYTVCYQGETLTGLNLIQKIYYLLHGGKLGACPPPPVDYCSTLDGIQAEDEDCPPPPVDVCKNIDGVQETVPAGMVVTEAGECVTPPPHVVTGSAAVICLLPAGVYQLSGTVDGNVADSVSPATLPGNTKGVSNVVVTRGDTSVRTTVTTNGDCGTTTTVTVAPPPPATVTPPATTAKPPAAKPKPQAKPKPKPKKRTTSVKKPKPKPKKAAPKPNKKPQKAPQTLSL